MIHVVFRLRRKRLTAQLTAQHPGSRLLLWCNLQTDVLEVRGKDEGQTAAIVRAFEAEHKPARRLGPGEPARTLLFKCPHRRGASVSRLVEEHGALLVPPVLCEAGWDVFRVFCFDPDAMEAFFRDLRAMGELEILSKRPFDAPVVEANFLLSATELVGDLTPKQAEAFLEAVTAGYYSVPRKATLQDIAKRLGRPRTTLEEHLRKAEGKLLGGLAPVVALRAWPKG